MDSFPPTDADLTARVSDGDAEALEELYSRYSKPVFGMSYSILRDYATAEDVTQEVFVALWTRADRFDPARGEFRHWFLHLAHNRIVDELRRRRRTALRSADKEPEDASLGLVSPGDTADQAVTAVLFDSFSDPPIRPLRGFPRRDVALVKHAITTGWKDTPGGLERF